MPNRLADEHLSHTWFAALAKGELPNHAVELSLFSEAARQCPVCREGLEAFCRAREARREPGAVIPFPTQRTAVASEPPPRDPRVLRALRELEGLGQAERLARVSRSRVRLRGAAMAEALLDRSRACLPGDGAGAADWADLALRVARRLSPSPAGSPGHGDEERRLTACEARAWGALANASRVLGDLSRAEALLAKAGRVVRHEAVTDLATLAELRSFGSSLRRDQRRTAEALHLAATSADLYRAAGQRRGELGSCMLLASIYEIAGEPERVLAAVRRAQSLLRPEDNERLRWFVVHGEISALVELEQHYEAALVLDESLALYARFSDSHTRNRLAWAQGRIARGLGQVAEAEVFLKEAQAGFLQARMVIDAAVVSLDLAILWLEQKRSAEVRELSGAMASTFEALGLPREALAAWRLFAEAAHQERASVSLARRVARFLVESQRDPALKFLAEG